MKRNLLFPLACIALIIAILILQFPLLPSLGVKSEKRYRPGTYKAKGIGRDGDVVVEVTFTSDRIKSVKVVEHHDLAGIGDLAVEEIPKRIVSEQSIAVDVISGATFTSTAILRAVEDCVRQAGGNLDTLIKRKTDDKPPEVEVLEYDIVVVGAGAAGTAAALAASERNDSVLLLEKTARPMGASVFAGGLFAADSSLQKKAGKTVDKKWLFDQYMKASSGYMNSILVRTIIEESGKTVDWLIENGCELNLVDAGTGGSYAHVGMPATLHGYKEGGRVAIEKLIESFKKNGGHVMFSTPAKELMKDSEGNIKGIVAEKEDGTILEIYAKAVILATGGFGGNEEMMKKYFGDKYTLGEITQNVGDGIRMAWDVGADEYGTSTAQYFWQKFTQSDVKALTNVLGYDYMSLTDFTFYPHLRVNTLGQRFSDETMASNFVIHGAQIHMQPNQTEFIILDTSVLKQIAEKGYASVEEHYGIWKDNRQFFMEFNMPTDTDELIKWENTPIDYTPLLDAAVGTGVVFKGNTLKELAKNMGVDANRFIESVNQYNKAIEEGIDNMFFADTERLIPVVEGPFYAVKYVARNLGTLGGVRINEKIEAVDKNGKPIPGLYVAGADAGGMYGKSYVDFEGGTLGFAYTSGRLAGINSAEYVKNSKQ
ncbi:FAD-dependent oxidoreductase [Tepidimicrobium xylanilyticum]|uniref:FAD-dependent oxidoreductase n=1 Tax=Tepidimicrobium xylanilyticum TaxID=1123352 RepID=UPI00264AB5A3|nr:FAD-dependent oxidoreductase [Tepidimicrobium xylanilyticum]GMG97007.1 FAD-binding dehydrogenase [Tepidimicrobium xylanilyticum]